MTHFITGSDTLVPQWLDGRDKFREVQQRIVTELQNQGDKNIYLYMPDGRELTDMVLEGHSLWHECTVDGLHFNDLGYFYTTKGLIQFLKENRLI
ncbi:MAG: hypothetical protein J6K12_04285 [Clostridia bacterium]|nr:hypothetical protein [Clostridia bacterium]